jgi:methionyl-tRNA synthetase
MRPFYVTTPIYYVNDVPHVGHAYTTVAADALARHARARGRETRFLTGTDEHGQKIEEGATERGLKPIELADQVVERFKATWRNLGIQYDDFIRTTEPRHAKVVTWLWQRLQAQDDIYLGEYEGWYCVACESFYTETQLDEGLVCPIHKRPVEKLKERSYFFRLAKYQDRLIEHIEKNPGFITPSSRRSEVLSFLRMDRLRDLSISRTSFRWGIPVPGDDAHIIYVWLDALTNYISALGAPDGNLYQKFWASPDAESVHLLGKDIVRFHAVIWPCTLLAAGLPLPKTVATHGWWTVRGQKISKSMPVTRVDPNMLAADLGADAVRYFLLREVPLGLDGDFSYEALLGRYKSDLGNDFGNLLNRSLGMAAKYVDAKVPDGQVDAELAKLADGAVDKADSDWNALQPSRALEATFSLIRAANEYIDRSEPWVLARSPEKAGQLASVCRTFLEACLVVGRLLAPVMPERAAALCRQLGFADGAAAASRWPARFGENLPAGQTLGKADPLFPRLDPDREAELLHKWVPAEPAAALANGTASAKREPAAEGGRAGGRGPDELGSGGREGKTLPSTIDYADFAKLDLRVAQVISAEPVPKADKLLKLQLDVGGEQRQVVAGIATAYAPDALVGKKVIFLSNLRPAKIRGVESQGMILAAGEETVVGLSAVDRDLPPGTKVR